MKWFLPRKWCSFVELPAKNFCAAIDKKNFKVGDKVSIQRTITSDDVHSFSEVTQDWNPIHRTRGVDGPVVVHGAFLNGLVSSVMGTYIPGPGSVLAEQLLKFPNPCFVGETVTVEVEIISVRKIVGCEFKCCVKDKIVLRGSAKLVINGNCS